MRYFRIREAGVGGSNPLTPTIKKQRLNYNPDITLSCCTDASTEIQFPKPLFYLARGTISVRSVTFVLTRRTASRYEYGMAR